MSTTATPTRTYVAQPSPYNPMLFEVVDVRRERAPGVPGLLVALLRRGGRLAAQAVADIYNDAQAQADEHRRAATPDVRPDPDREVLVYSVATRGAYEVDGHVVRSSYSGLYAAHSPDEALQQAKASWVKAHGPKGMHRVYFDGASVARLRRAAHPGSRPADGNGHLAMERYLRQHALVYDQHGAPVYVGAQVVHATGTQGVVLAVHEPDGDMDEYNRPVGINASVQVRWGDGFLAPVEEERVQTWANRTYPEPSHYVLDEDVEVLP